MPASGTYANGPQLTVDMALKSPTFLSRQATALMAKKLVSKRLFVRGPNVEGGAVQFSREQGIFMDRDAETIAERAKWPRTGYSEQIVTDAVDQFGLEFPVSNLAIRRNRTDQLRNGMIRTANTVAKNIDTVAMAVLESDPLIQTNASAAVWTAAATDIIDEIAEAQELIETQDLGYDGFEGATLVLHTSRRQDLINNTGLRAALPRESRDSAISTGMIAPFLGLKEILFTPRITATVGLLIDTSIAGTVMDEIPDPQEGWQTFNADPSVDPVYSMVYDDKTTKDKIVAIGRWPVFFLNDPKAVVKITGIA